MEEKQCYSECEQPAEDAQNVFKCEICKKLFHIDCLKSNKPSPLVGDIFFDFKCADCCESGQEVFVRMKLPWLPVVMLALYNLQLSNTGCQGYFRGREHICGFIEKHWTVFFARGRRKTHTWFGTVAGVLSIWSPTYFLSGTKELNQTGWWKLTNNSPPTLDIMDASTRCPKKKKSSPTGAGNPSLCRPSGLRFRDNKSSIQTAIELKAKRDIMPRQQSVQKFCDDGGVADAEPLSEHEELDDVDPVDDERDSVTSDMSQTSGCSYSAYDCLDQSSQMSKSSCISDGWLTEKDLVVGDSLPEFLMKEDEDEDDDLDIDPCTMSPERAISPVMTTASNLSNRLPPLEDIIACMGSSVKHEWNPLTIDNETEQVSSSDEKPVDASVDEWDQKLNREVLMNEADDFELNRSATDENPNADETVEGLVANAESTRRRKRRQEAEDEMTASAAAAEPKLVLMSLYEEKQLVKRFRLLDDSVKLDPALRRLRQKLFVREQQRELGVQVFDIDLLTNRLNGTDHGLQNASVSDALIRTQPGQARDEANGQTDGLSFPTDSQVDDFRILDRYQTSRHSYQKPQSSSFLNRLIGSDGPNLSRIYSPYTARSLPPFIRRDYESRPMKLQLLQDLVAYHHRKDPDWKPEPSAPIDFCYVRPQHIPSVNALCKEFFWPGIDLSECLQYPDFSCVALYRKFVVGFAFMVPDVKYNESYISFIFTHPEWRRAGIASFMLYHLTQTIKGQEITLHVSASNPALLLYQKFGFKEEEFLLDFYDKYFPLESTECRHALFMRGENAAISGRFYTPKIVVSALVLYSIYYHMKYNQNRWTDKHGWNIYSTKPTLLPDGVELPNKDHDDFYDRGFKSRKVLLDLKNSTAPN